MTSVIIPVHNAEPYVGDLLDSLVKQDFAGAWEVVVVDNRSTDQSISIANRYSLSLPIRIVIAGDRPNPAYARNAGASTSSADNLLFIDADDAVDEHYVTAMTEALQTTPFVTSRVDSSTLNPDWVRGAHGDPWQTNGVDVFFGFLAAAGANIGIRRALFNEIGGFSETFSCAEDLAFSWQAQLSTGVAPHFVGNAVYRYRYRSTFWLLFRQGVGWGADSVLLYRTFGPKGMPGRSAGTAIKEWAQVCGGLLSFPNGKQRAPLLARLGLCIGRLKGALQFRVNYF